jgi:hypothetical protein
MPQQAVPTPSLEAVRVRAWSDELRAKAFETDAFPFIQAERGSKVLFAPHRVVGNYADYRKLGGRKGWLFG